MSMEHWIQTIIEIVLALGIIWCFVHEGKLIRLENRILGRLNRWQRRVRRRIIAWGDKRWGKPVNQS